MRTVDDYISVAQHLVPAPVIVPQILPLLRQDDVDAGKVVDLIKHDQTLTANVLRVCNSAYYSAGTPIDNLQYAVMRVGFREIYEIIVSVVFSVTLGRPQDGYGVEPNELWEHSVATAVAAQRVGHDAGLDEQLVFTAALLHDIGKIILSPALTKMRREFTRESRQNKLSPFEIEMKLLGASHAEVGGRLLERWRLPQTLVASVRHHHQPAAAKGYEQLTACVNLGNFIAYFMGHGYGKHTLDQKAHRETAEIIDLSQEQIHQYMNESLEKLEQVKHLYNIRSSSSVAKTSPAH